MSSPPARSPACDPSCADPQHLLEHHSAGALQLGIQSFISRSTCRSIVSAGELTWILPFQLKLVSWSFRKSKFMICVCLALLPVAAALRVAEDAHVRGAEWMSKLAERGALAFGLCPGEDQRIAARFSAVSSRFRAILLAVFGRFLMLRSRNRIMDQLTRAPGLMRSCAFDRRVFRWGHKTCYAYL